MIIPRAKISILFVLLLFFFSNCLTPLEQRKFKWQIHSFNDPRELGQILKKGSTLLKIDLYFATHSGCFTKDPRANTNPKGCFLLVHDRPQKNYFYDSIYDYFDELEKYKKYFQSTKVKINLALCFKNTPCDICLWDFYHWKDLVDELYSYIDDFITKNNFNIEIVYDGNKEKCVRDKWPNWIYTWIRGRDPDEAFTSSSVESHYDKYTIFNDKYSDLEADAKKDWGKFKDINRPLQMWEPIHQKDVQYYANVFTSHPHKVGYAYAINSDPSMYQVYTADISKENFNFNLIKDKNFSMKNSVYIILNGKNLLFFNSIDKKMRVYDIDTNKNTIDEKSIQEISTIPEGELGNCIYLGKIGNNELIIVDNKQGDFSLFLIDSINYQIKQTKSGNYKDLLDNKENCVNSLISCDNTIYVSSVSSRFLHSENSFKLIISLVDSTYLNKIILIPGQINYDLQFEVNSSKKKIINFSNNIRDINIKCFGNDCLLLHQFVDDTEMNSSYITVDNNDDMIVNLNWKKFGVGNNFSLDIINDGIKTYFFIVKDGAYCYHTEAKNKDAKIKVCDQKEISMPHILNYIYGELNINDLDNQYSSVCSKSTLTGTFDMGDYPKVSMFINQQNQKDFIIMHDALRKGTEVNKDCGLSLYREGIILDNWNIGDVNIDNL